MLKSYARTSVRLGLALMLMIGIFGASFAAAQSTTDGAIGGTVTDQSGAVVSGAKVTAMNLGTNAASSTTTDDTGRYRIIQLRPGRYSLEVTAGNFTPFKAPNVIVEVGLVTTVESRLGVTAQAEAVEVTGEAPVINTQQQDFSTNVNQISINELPINGRRWSQFALLTPGATPDGNFGLVSFRGISGLLNNNTVDGGDNNNAFYSEERGRTRIGYVISQSAIQEFQVNTSNFSAEYGRAAGAVVNAVTKSGTNQFHGSGFWYYRNEELNAFNPFVTVLGQPVKPLDRRHQFGGTVGGPIIKDKVFFFFSYDQQKRNFPGVANAGVPSDFFAPFTAADLATLGARGVTPAQAQLGLDYLLSLTGEVPRKGDQTLFLPKIDWSIAHNHSLSLSYNRLRWDSPAGIQAAGVSINRSRTGWGNDIVKTDWFNAKLNSALSPRISNEMRLQWSRDFLAGTAQEPAANEPISPLGLPVGANIGTSTGGAGGLTIGTPDYLPRDKNPIERRIQGANNTSFALGRHLVKAGVDIGHVNDSLDSLFNKFGTYAYSNRLDWITDFSDPAGTRRYTSYTQGFGLQQFELDTLDLNIYMQDDFRVHPRVTLNLGLRYETIFMPEPFLPNSLLPQTAVLPKDRNNFGPRFGVAWDPFGDAKTAIRGGYGMYYGRYVNSTISSALVQTGVAGAAKNFTFRPADAGAPRYPDVLTSVSAVATAAPDVVIYPEDSQAPVVHQFDIVFEREILRNTVVSASYIGSRGYKLPAFLDRNLPTTTTSRNVTVVGGEFDGQVFPVNVYTGNRPNTNFARIIAIDHIVRTDYDGFVVQLNRRMAKGLQFMTNYTFASADDNGQRSQTFIPSNGSVYDPNDIGREQARSNFDVRHRFVASTVWQPVYFSKAENQVLRWLLSDYTISPIVTVSSGRPITGTVSGNASGCGTGLTGINCAGAVSRAPFIPRNHYSEPTFANVDLRLARRIGIQEKATVELVAEAFNLFNHVNVISTNTRQFTVGGNAAAQTLQADPSFLVPTGSVGTLSRERQLQFAVRFQF